MTIRLLVHIFLYVWGQRLTSPAYGALALLDWDGNGTIDHVTFVVGVNGNLINDLGGNQGVTKIYDGVTLGRVPSVNIVGYRYPNGYTPTYFNP